MRVSEEPVCIYLFQQNPVFTSLHLRSLVHVVPPQDPRRLLSSHRVLSEKAETSFLNIVLGGFSYLLTFAMKTSCNLIYKFLYKKGKKACKHSELQLTQLFVVKNSRFRMFSRFLLSRSKQTRACI